MSAISSIVAAIGLLLVMIYIRHNQDLTGANNFSLYVLLFTHFANHIGSAAMHATFEQCLCDSDSYTMHIGLLIRMFALLVGNQYPWWTYIVCALVANFYFVDRNTVLVCIVSAVLYLQVMANYELHIWLRWITLFAVLSLVFQVLSRAPSAEHCTAECCGAAAERYVASTIRTINQTIDTHAIWHILITITIIVYVWVFLNRSPTDRWVVGCGKHIDHLFYAGIFVVTFLFSLVGYGEVLFRCICV